MVEQNTLLIEETAEQKRLRLQREAKREQRKRQREAVVDSRPMVEASWKKSLANLSPTARRKLDGHIEDWNYIFDICYQTANSIRANVEYNSEDGDLPHRPEEYFAEVEAFAKQFPPTDRPETFKTFLVNIERKISDEDFYFRTYGQGVDHVDHVVYFDFISEFGKWYLKNRNFLVLAIVNEYSRTWEQVEKLMAENPRLKHLVGHAQPKVPASTPPHL